MSVSKPTRRTAGKAVTGARPCNKKVAPSSPARASRSNPAPAGATAKSRITTKVTKTRARDVDPLEPARVIEILARLEATYPNAVCALKHRSAWELLVATILSAQCTDVRVNLVTPALFAKYPTVKHFAALQPEDLEPDIRSTGFFRNKSKSVVGAARLVVSDFGGKVPQTMPELLTLPGVARKTANVVMGSFFRIPEGVVVDTHVHRISRRLELTRNQDPVKIEQDLMRIIPRDRWISFSHQVIYHGRALCIARRPRCAECPLENICHAADKTWSTVPLHPAAI